MKRLKFGYTLSFIVFLFVICTKPTAAQVVINEISDQPADKYDWVELFSPTPVDISGWKVGDEAGVFETIPQGTQLGPNIYFVVSQYQRLDNESDTVILYNNSDVEINKIIYGKSNSVCVSSETGSIARIPDGGNTIDRLASNTKGSSNGELATDPCPTPTPVPTNSPTNVPTNTPTNSPTPTPKPSNTLTPTATKKPTNTPTEPEESPAEGDELVLGSTDPLLSSTPIPTETSENDNGGKNFPFVPVLFIILGIGFIGSAVFLVLKGRKENLKTLENVEKFTRQDN